MVIIIKLLIKSQSQSQSQQHPPSPYFIKIIVHLLTQRSRIFYRGNLYLKYFSLDVQCQHKNFTNFLKTIIWKPSKCILLYLGVFGFSITTFAKVRYSLHSWDWDDENTLNLRHPMVFF